MSKFNQVINELMGVTDVIPQTEPSKVGVNPTNDDSYARGDARNPLKLKYKKKKKKIIKEGYTEDSKIQKLHPDIEFINTSEFVLDEDLNIFRLKSHIVNNVFEKTRIWARPLKRFKGQSLFRRFDFRKMVQEISKEEGSGKTFSIGTYQVEDEIKVKYDIS